jgi:hypothetical protein
MAAFNQLFDNTFYPIGGGQKEAGQPDAAATRNVSF